MFTSLKNFINSRLGKGVVLEDSSNDYGYFIHVDARNLYSVLSFLKNDPDLKLTLLDQIISIPSPCFPSINNNERSNDTIKILYQLKSLKLPYRVTVVLEINRITETIPSISPLFRGARWQENDLEQNYGVIIEESLRDQFKKKSTLKFDDSLIISRLQQKELLDIKHNIDFDPKFFPVVNKTSLIPFFSDTPFNVGLDVMLIGSKIINSQVIRGFFYHGLENTLAQCSPHDAILAIARLNMASPIFYQIALMMAFEALIETKIPDHVAYHRAIALEFGRIDHHLRVLKNVISCLDLHGPAHLLQDLSEVLKKPLKTFCRTHSERAVITDVIPLNEAHEVLFDALALTEELRASMSYEVRIVEILSKKASMSLSMASSMGLTGLFLRANRSYYDLRHQMEANLYEKPPSISVTDGGDALARFTLRILEITASLRWLRQSFLHAKQESFALAPIVINDNCYKEPHKKSFAFGELEGPEGVIKTSIFVDEKQNSLIFRVRTPAYFIAQTIPYLLSQADLRYVPTILYSLGITAEEIDK